MLKNSPIGECLTLCKRLLEEMALDGRSQTDRSNPLCLLRFNFECAWHGFAQLGKK